MASLAQLISVRSQAVEACLEYLRELEASLAHNPLLKHAGKTLNGPLRVPLECRRHDTAKVEEELRQREQTRLEGSGAIEEGQLYSRAEPPHDAEIPWWERRKAVEDKFRPSFLEEISREKADLVVLGDPGAGKSEWLKLETMLVARAERRWLEDRHFLDDAIRLPIFLTFPQLASALTKNEDEMREFHAEILHRPGAPSWAALNAAAKHFVRVLWVLKEQSWNGVRFQTQDLNGEEHERRRRSVLAKLWRDSWIGQARVSDPGADWPTPVACFDAWDEVRESEEQEAILTALEGLHAHLAPAGYRWRLTSRVVGYNASLGREEDTFELLPLKRQSSRTFLRDFFTDDPARAESLVTELAAKPAVSGLAQNPLMLTLLALVFRPSGLGTKRVELPARRVKIFDAVLEDLLGALESGRKDRGTVKDALVRQKRAALREIAWHFWPRQLLAGAELEAFCDFHLQPGPVLMRAMEKKSRSLYEILTEDEPVLVPCGSDYRFLHLTLQEYFVAEHLAATVNLAGWDHAQVSYADADFRRQPIAVTTLLDRKSWLAAWRQVVLLTAGMLDDPFPLLTLLGGKSAHRPSEVDDLLGHRRELAVLAAGEIRPERWPADRRLQKWAEGMTAAAFRWWFQFDDASRGCLPWLGHALSILSEAQATYGQRTTSSKLAKIFRVKANREAALQLLASFPAASLWSELGEGFLLGSLGGGDLESKDTMIKALSQAPGSFWERVDPETLFAQLVDPELDAPETENSRLRDFLGGYPPELPKCAVAATLGCAPDEWWRHVDPAILRTRFADRRLAVRYAAALFLVYAPEWLWDGLKADDLRQLLEDSSPLVRYVALQALRGAPGTVWEKLSPRVLLARLSEDDWDQRPMLDHDSVYVVYHIPPPDYQGPECFHSRVNPHPENASRSRLARFRSERCSTKSLPRRPSHSELYDLYKRLNKQNAFVSAAAVQAVRSAPESFWAGVTSDDWRWLLENGIKARSPLEIALRFVPDAFWDRLDAGLLIALLASDNYQPRLFAVAILERAPARVWAGLEPKHLLEPLSRGDVWSTAIVRALKYAPESFWSRIHPQDLRARLTHPHPTVRQVAVFALGVSPHFFWMRMEMQDLRDRLTDASAVVRARAVQVLGRADERWFGNIGRLLHAGLDDPEAKVRSEALELLATCAPWVWKQIELARLLPRITDENDMVQTRLMDALKRAPDLFWQQESSYEFLSQVVSTLPGYPSQDVLAQAPEWFWNRIEPHKLLAHLADDYNGRDSNCGPLFKVAKESFWQRMSGDALAKYLTAENPQTRRAALNALAVAPESFWKRQAAGLLIACCTDPSDSVREAAMQTLAEAPEMFWERVDPQTLCAGLADREISPRWATAKTLRTAPASFWNRVDPAVLGPLLPIDDRYRRADLVAALGAAPETYWSRLTPSQLQVHVLGKDWRSPKAIRGIGDFIPVSIGELLLRGTRREESYYYEKEKRAFNCSLTMQLAAHGLRLQGHVAKRHCLRLMRINDLVRLHSALPITGQPPRKKRANSKAVAARNGIQGGRLK